MQVGAEQYNVFCKHLHRACRARTAAIEGIGIEGARAEGAVARVHLDLSACAQPQGFDREQCTRVLDDDIAGCQPDVAAVARGRALCAHGQELAMLADAGCIHLYGATRCTADIDHTVEQGHCGRNAALTAHPSALARGGRSIQGAGVADPGAFQVNLPTPADQACGPDGAAVVDHTVQGRACLPCRHGHPLAGSDGAAVLQAGLQAGVCYPGADQAVPGNVQGNRVAGRQCGGGGNDLAGVLHLVGDQGHTLGGSDQTLIADDAGVARPTREVVAAVDIARHKVGIADAQCGGQKAAHVDLGTRGEQHA